MNILCIGDICGNIGCDFIKNNLYHIKKYYSIDFTVANGENSAEGNGITPLSAQTLFTYGVDVITGGNHSLRRKEAHALLDENNFLLTPDNIPQDIGHGYCLVDMGRLKIAVVNILGNAYLDSYGASNCFDTADKLVDCAKNDNANIIIVDFHAEATGEKKALGYYLDGRVSAFFGTHTHIQTADEQILDGGTGYITDIGMTGPVNSVLGVKKEIIIDRLRNKSLEKFTLADGECMLNGCIFTVDEKTGLTTSVKRINITEGAQSN